MESPTDSVPPSPEELSPAHHPVPGRRAFGPLVAGFDQRVDALLEHGRGQPAADRLFTTASHVGEFSLVWHGASLVRGVARKHPDQVVLLAVLIGLESLIVNQGIKRIFKRTRPTPAGEEGLRVRAPITSSFPSGHASAAAFAATMLTAWDGRRWAPLWVSVAGVIGISRAYVRVHHASDVVGGFVVGGLLGIAGRAISRRLGVR